MMNKYTGVVIERKVKYYKEGEEVTRKEFKDARQEQCRDRGYKIVDIFTQESKVQSTVEVDASQVATPEVAVPVEPTPPSAAPVEPSPTVDI